MVAKNQLNLKKGWDDSVAKFVLLQSGIIN